jgi:acyl dehydratase
MSGASGSSGTIVQPVTTPTRIPNTRSIKDFVGKPLGPTEWHVVSQEMIDAFARATGDTQWIHVDPERAKRESPFGTAIAHGYLTLAMIPVLVSEVLVVEQTSLTVNAGLGRVKLPAPVPAGSRVRMHAEIQNVRELPGGGARTGMLVRFEVEGGTKPVCIAETIFVYYPQR